VAVQVTVVVAIGNVDPEPGVHVGVTAPLTMSVADAEKETTAPLGPVASAVMSPGTVTAGGVVSRTVTVNVFAELVLPASSVAVQLTVVVVIGNVLPDGGAHEIVGVASTLSVAVTV
jgi:hypothetical protein